MTLLTYAGKYITQSLTSVTSTSTDFGDDTQASRTFTLNSSKTVLVIYAANSRHGNSNAVNGFKNAINVDGTDHSIMAQSNYAANYTIKNTCVWVGTLAAGSHTVTGRLACNVASTTISVTNRTLLVYIFDGDEFNYIEDATQAQISSTTYVDDANASVTATPSGACKALIFYGVTNDAGTTERYTGKKILINTGATDQTASEMFQSGYSTGGTNADSNTTVWAESITATSRTFKGRWAGNGAQPTTLSRRFFCVLFLADSTILDTDTDTTSVNSITTTMADDSYISITRSQEGELLCLYAATKATGTTSSTAGTHYGIMLDTVDVADSRSSPAYSSDGTQALVAYAASVAAGSHEIKGRFSTNYSTTSAYVTSKIMIALWFPVKTPLTYNNKYVITDGTTVSSSSTTLADDTPASKTFSLSATQTVLAFYASNSDYGNTNDVAGFKNAINVDGTDYSTMYASGYAANYPMRNCCVWAGTLASGSHTIKGRFASNTDATNTSITNRTLIIYILNGDAVYYLDDATTQSLAAAEAYVDDSKAVFSITPKANCKALILYGVTNAPGNAEHYVGKKACVSVNGTDYTECEAKQSSYSTGGSNPDSLAVAYGLSLTANTNYVVKGRASSAYTYATSITRRFIAVLLFDDTTLIDTDSSVVSENVTSANLVDDPDISIARTTAGNGELLVFYNGCKTISTTSDIQGTRFGIMIDGHDTVASRTSQAYSGSANSCLVGMASTVFDASHTIKGRYSANESTGTVYITTRFMIALWLARTVVNQTFSNTHDVQLKKSFIGRNDLAVWKTYASSNDIIAQILLNKYFQATNDIKVLKTWLSHNDERLSKPFSNKTDIDIKKYFSGSSDLKLSKAFLSSGDLKIIKAFSSTLDLKLSKAFINRDDIRLYKAYTETNDIKVYKQYASSNDEKLYKAFSVITDIKVLKTWLSHNDERLSKSSSARNDITVKVHFTNTSDIKALYTWAYHNSNDIKLIKAFSSISDLKLIKAFQSLSDALYSKIISSHDDILLSTKKSSSNDLRLIKKFSAANDLTLHQAFEASLDILLSLHKTASNDIRTHGTNVSTSDIRLSKALGNTNDIFEALFVQNTNDISLYKHFSSHNEILGLIWAHFASSNNIQISKAFESYSDITYSDVFSSTNDVDMLKQFAARNDILRTSLKFTRNDIRLTKYCTSRNDIRVYKVWSSKNTLWLYSTKSSKNDIKIIRNFVNSNDLDMYKTLASTNDVFVKKNFSAASKVKVDHYVESSNNVLLEKEFKSINDVFEFLQKLFTSKNAILLVEEFINSNNININKTFSSTNIVVRVIWDLVYPLTVVVSQDERTITISTISRKVFLDELSDKTATIDLQNRTVTIDQSDRGVTINKW
ncbi:MAG: hypothetical protein PHN69_04085 [Candidatus Pacebacteria bacterium]|nr:hypothetical protein [Candidatus Paceibacterota bacterium]